MSLSYLASSAHVDKGDIGRDYLKWRSERRNAAAAVSGAGSKHEKLASPSLPPSLSPGVQYSGRFSMVQHFLRADNTTVSEFAVTPEVPVFATRCRWHDDYVNSSVEVVSEWGMLRVLAVQLVTFQFNVSSANGSPLPRMESDRVMSLMQVRCLSTTGAPVWTNALLALDLVFVEANAKNRKVKWFCWSAQITIISSILYS